LSDDMTTQTPGPSPSERLDAAEEQMIHELDVRIAKSPLFLMGDTDPSRPGYESNIVPSTNPRSYVLQSDDPRLQKMPQKPQLFDFFKYRFGPNNHLLQSAKHALNAGHDEETVLACLLHDIAVIGFIRSDHGWWGAQLIEPYVSEKVSWAVRAHQVLRFFPDPSVGYEYPEMYIRLFGEDFEPEDYIKEEYNRIKNHKWYMTGRLITINDIYSFDPDARVEMEEFEDIIGRNFRQPEEGLGFDGSPVSHMWRTLIWPTRYL
jgi:hypothetical protein